MWPYSFHPSISYGPRFKVARHLGVNVFNHPKALKRGIKTLKLSEYGKQLLEKQKLKAYYGLLEKQFKNYVFDSLKARGNSENVLLQILECRLDNIVYRLGFASTLRQARQMVVHGHIVVNNRKLDRPSYQVKLTDVIALCEKSRENPMFADNFAAVDIFVNYLEKDINNFTGRLTRVPNKDEIPIKVIASRIIEFYSKN
jgi:small subunit ribosomal protein S4